MTRRTHHIVYVGCVLAGKMYSVHSLLMRNRQPLPDPMSALRERPCVFELTRTGEPLVTVSLRISDKRATTIDYDPTSIACDPGIREEISQIASADGLVFVIDSQLGREEANMGALARLRRDMSQVGADLQSMPVVFQANKRDLPAIVTMEWVRENFRVDRSVYVESSAKNHVGTLEGLRELLRLTGAIDSST